MPISAIKKTGPLLYVGLALIAITAGVLTRQATTYDFSTSSGARYQLADFRGQWLIINYFAPWCAPCLKEIPQLNQFAQQLPENTHLFAVNYDPADRQQVIALKQRYNINFEVIVAGPETRLPVATPAALPATFIIGPDGQLAETIMGEITQARLQQTLASLKQGD
ncbi:TlpA family protein disulfide reductase [Salinimonas sediminis]|uniref:TlpA family protein disulfide reductase n=1 Tax=Salinimonas sediminis TaxID=2303538 RepID=A0A346NMP1_9ALTE|nr:TlpA disulfide reductase family protein [Salinimonas sediminis]AXR06798.1 TlpA family protein disulfide reductase [Salinimonas sediminis]